MKRIQRKSARDLPDQSAPIPAHVELQLAQLVDKAPDGERWLHEIKFDGYRLVAFRDGKQVALRTRKMLDWTARFPKIAEALLQLPVEQAVLDGELTALLPNGVSSFGALQEALSSGQTSSLVYHAFDLLYLDGQSLAALPLVARKLRLAELLDAAKQTRLQYVEHVLGDGPIFFEHCRRLGLEGIVSKRAQGLHKKGRTGAWLKVKCAKREAFVIGGYLESDDKRRGIASILVGSVANGELRYAGSVGTGFSDKALEQLQRELALRGATTSPFVDFGPRQAGRGTHWVRPELVAQVRYTDRTRDGRLRHPVFEGLCSHLTN